MLEVLVAVPTFRRNAHLEELLPMLVAQAGHAGASDRYRVSVVIIDNDPLAGAEETVRRLGGQLIRYVHEPEPGLSAVRNRALREAESSRLLAFMDDDGRPDDGWLTALLAVWERTGAAAVAGRVIEHYEVDPDPWIEAGGFFRRRSLPTFTVVGAAPTTNLLIDLAAVRALGLRFEPRFGMGGGEDTLFTRQLTAAGERIAWCEESRVIDQVPAARMNRAWVLARARSHGNSASLVDLAMVAPGLPRLRVRVARCVGGLTRCAAGATRYGWGLVRGDLGHQARGLRLAHRGIGMLTGSLGHVVEEYAR